MLLNEHSFTSSAPEPDDECTRCGLQWKFANSWRTTCRPRRKPTPEPEALTDIAIVRQIFGGAVW